MKRLVFFLVFSLLFSSAIFADEHPPVVGPPKPPNILELGFDFAKGFFGFADKTADKIFSLISMMGELTDIQKKQAKDIKRINGYFEKLDEGVTYKEVIDEVNPETGSYVRKVDGNLYQMSNTFEELLNDSFGVANMNPYFFVETSVENMMNPYQPSGSQSPIVSDGDEYNYLNTSKSPKGAPYIESVSDKDAKKTIQASQKIQGAIAKANPKTVDKINAQNTAKMNEEIAKLRLQLTSLQKQIDESNKIQKKSFELSLPMFTLHKKAKTLAQKEEDYLKEPDTDQWKANRKKARTMYHNMFWSFAQEDN